MGPQYANEYFRSDRIFLTLLDFFLILLCFESELNEPDQMPIPRKKHTTDRRESERNAGACRAAERERETELREQEREPCEGDKIRNMERGERKARKREGS